MLCGIYPHGSYEGEIIFAGETLQANHIRDTERKGIAIIHQELALVKHLTVLENIFLGAEISRHGLLDYETMTLRCQKLLAQVNLPISPDTRVGDLGLGQQQLVEIAKALNKQVRLLILGRTDRFLNRTRDRDAADDHSRSAKPRYRLHLYFSQAQ
ncbi:D-xylose transport ATP-binding protein XylG [Klebsiella variicola]|uniref:D-xylose transport ATP-binding protein XylG n=1 Tax=Klebsiella variicola TaxID=244366 RepID=A0A7H4M9K4_KLEVA|nr:D-xylose transport ATP-binding protein XylG [Klebsiella variicola]